MVCRLVICLKLYVKHCLFYADIERKVLRCFYLNLFLH